MIECLEHDSPVKKKKKNSDDVCSDDDSGLKMEVKKSDLQEENPGLLSSLDLVSGSCDSRMFAFITFKVHSNKLKFLELHFCPFEIVVILI